LLGLILLKVPYILSGLPILRPELEWMLLAERMNAGESMYSEIWSNTGPLSSLIYSVIHFLFGRSQLHYELFALVVVYFQALLFTLISNNNRLTVERNYLPALFYVLVMSLAFDLSKISPPLMALTFLLLSMNSLFKQIENKEDGSEHVFEIGLHLGIGSLFWYPMPLFFVWAILSLLMFTSLTFKKFLLIFLGFLLPQSGVVLYYYFQGSFFDYYQNWIVMGINPHFFKGLDFKIIGLVFGVPLILAFLGVFKVMRAARYNNFQARKHQVLIFSGLFGFLVYLLSNEGTAYQMLGLVPFIVFFIMGFFIHMKGTYIPELLFIGVLVVFAGINAAGLNRLAGAGFEHLADLRVNEKEINPYLSGKRILVTGEKNDDYLYAYSTTKYLNWRLSENELRSINTYEGLVAVHSEFRKELPEYIIDNGNVFPEIFLRIPGMAKLYEKTERVSQYKLKEKSSKTSL
jgi:hypothetical protein